MFFKTSDTTVSVHNIQALSRHGSALNIHLHGKEKPVISRPDGDWELEDYTEQWQDLLYATTPSFGAEAREATLTE